jgi:hypothetical protein
MRIDDFLETATTETDADRLWTAAVDWLSYQGFDKVLHLSISDGTVRARTTLGTDFEQYYNAEGLARHDPFPKYCLTAPGPVSTGIDYLSEYNQKSVGSSQRQRMPTSGRVSLWLCGVTVLAAKAGIWGPP